MILSEHNICHYLLETGMIDAATIVNGQFSARRSDSRNNNFVINKEYEKDNYFIKQVKAGDQEKIDTLHTEAACYKLAQQDKQYQVLQKFMPRFYHFDPRQHILVTEEIKNSISLNDYFLATYSFDAGPAKKIAELLSSYHSAINNNQQQPGLSFFKRQKPWVFTIPNNPGHWAGTAQTAEQQAMQLIFKNTEFVQLIARQEGLWQPASLIHNDVKFTNFLVPHQSVEKGVDSLKLIDWELADIGDPLWDAASVFQNYILLSVSTDVPEHATYPGFKKITLQQVQPCIKAFWQEYSRLMKFEQQANLMLEKTTAFAALKLLHSCFEYTPHAANLQPISVKLLQIAHNVLKSPATAAVQLFGIQ